jgi:hypothetical protein
MSGAAAVEARVGRRIWGRTAAQARGRRGAVGVGKHRGVAGKYTRSFIILFLLPVFPVPM